MKTLYISDLDGTLLTPSVNLSKFTVETINSFTEKGMVFTFATARSFSSAKKLLGELKLKYPVIIYNGTAIQNPITNEYVTKNTFADKDSKKIFQIMKSHNYHPVVYSFFGNEERVSWLAGSESSGIEKYIASRAGDKRLRCCNSDEATMEGEIYYFTCIDTKERLLPLFNEIDELDCCSAFFQKELYDNYYWLEIMCKNSNKGNAVNELKKYLNCEKVVAFGDSINDIPMFNVADECYAMENATEELKKISTGTIQSNQQDGVANWLAQNITRES